MPKRQKSNKKNSQSNYVYVHKNQKIILGKHHPQTLVTCNNLGVLYKQQEKMKN